MKLAILVFSFILICPQWRAAAQESAMAPNTNAIRQLQQVDLAQKYYAESLALLSQGKRSAAKRKLRKAFKLLSDLTVESDLMEQIRPEVENWLEKIRSVQTSESEELSEPPVEANDLDVMPEELAAATTGAASVGMPDVSRYTIAVDTANALVQRYISIYTGPRYEKVNAALERSGNYREIVMPMLKSMGLPRELFYLMMVESEYKIFAYSRAGAAGLWQLMPETARRLGLKVNYWIDERFDPELATAAALKYLKELYYHFDDWHLALAAYNRGEHGIGRDLAFTKATAFSTLSHHKAMPSETEHFVPKFMACVLIGDNPRYYGFRPRYEKPEPYDVVELDRPLDLKIAAEAASTTEEKLRQLNPAIRAWCTPINYSPFKLRIPYGKTQQFWDKLAQVKDWNPAREMVRHTVKKGEVLSVIARRYRTTVKDIMQQNSIRNPAHLRVGQVLNIRPGKRYFSD